MDDSPYPQKSLALSLASAFLIMSGCADLPPSLLSLNSPTTDENQVFDKQLIGTWAASSERDPSIVLTVTRDAKAPQRYSLCMNDPKDPNGNAELTFGLRLLKIGSSEFVEVAETMPQDTPADQRLTVAGKPFHTGYFLWRVTRTQNAVQVWGFENPQIIESLPTAEMVPAVPAGKNDRIINCSAERLQQFLLKNGHHMTKHAGLFKRLQRGG
jgi:hypothetical protein